MDYFQLFLYVLSGWAFLAILAMGFGITLRSLKFFNVAYGGAFLIGGYMMFLLYRTLTLPLVPSFLFSLFLSGMYLSLAYLFIFKPLLKRKSSNFVLLIASFGLLIMTIGALGIAFGNQVTLLRATFKRCLYYTSMECEPKHYSNT